MSDLTTNDLVDKAMSVLDSGDGADPAAGKSPEDQILERLDAGDGEPDQGAGETASDTTPEKVETETPAEVKEPAAATGPSIEPPGSWKAEWKEQFKALPPEAQKIIAERESERERGLAKTQQESAEARKAHETERAAVQEERKAYATRLTTLVDIAPVVDPLIAKGRQTDWGKELRDDPLGAPVRKYEYEQGERRLAMLVQERDSVLQKIRYDNYQAGQKALAEKLPDIWPHDDKRKAFQSEFSKYLQDNGFKAEEAGSIDDYRAMLLGRKAMLYDQLMAQQSKIAATKVVPAQGKVVRSQSNETTGSNARAEALAKRAIKTGRTDDSVDAIMAALG